MGVTVEGGCFVAEVRDYHRLVEILNSANMDNKILNKI